jgi:uncharacterized protein with PQ loop repeat
MNSLILVLSLAAGTLNILSSAPQLLRAIRAGSQGATEEKSRDVAQIRGRVMQLAGNLLWVVVGVLTGNVGLWGSCAVAAMLLALLLWVLGRGGHTRHQ